MDGWTSVNNAAFAGSSVGSPTDRGWHRNHRGQPTSVVPRQPSSREQLAKTGGGSIVNISSIGVVGSTSGPSRLQARKRRANLFKGCGSAAMAPSGREGQQGQTLHAAILERDQSRHERADKIAATRCAASASRSRWPMACWSSPPMKRPCDPAPSW